MDYRKILGTSLYYWLPRKRVTLIPTEPGAVYTLLQMAYELPGRV